MRRVGVWAAWIGVVSCGGGELGVSGSNPALSDTAVGVAVESLLLREVALPEPEAGKLVGRTPLVELLTAALPARVGRCDRPKSLQVLAEGDTIDALVVVYFGGEPKAGKYSVVPRDRPPPGGGYARVGVQRVGYLTHFYEAIEGSVELASLDRSATGSLNVVLREISSGEKVRYAAVFSELRLGPWPQEYCGEPVPPDSVATLDRPIG